MPSPSPRKNLLPGSLKRHVSYWRELETVADLAVLLRVPQHQLQLLSLQPRYKTYEIPKRDGSKRLIEDPAPALKAVQRKINHYLQASYFFIRPPVVHGFCIRPRHTEARNILSNARVHLGQPHLLNMDLEDFFHFVTAEKVDAIFRDHFPRMRPELIETLTRLSTRWQRLPMGAPTSPALSNWACLGLDADLETLARYQGWNYTRFADDMCFSGAEAIPTEAIETIRQTVHGYDFKFNEEKIQQYREGEPRMVTGLCVTQDQIQLPAGYLDELQDEIKRLRAFKQVEYRYRTGTSRRKLKRFEQELQGKLNFAAMVLGGAAPEVEAVAAQLETAQGAPEAFAAVSWLEIPYSFLEW